jgi:very-short-patch-repair endonuclease
MILRPWWGFGPTKIERLLGAALVRAGIPFEREYRVRTPRCTYRLDFAVVDSKLDIEADGPYHGTPKGRWHDHERDVNLHLAGWWTLRFRQEEIERSPDECAFIAAEILRMRRAGLPLPHNRRDHDALKERIRARLRSRP